MVRPDSPLGYANAAADTMMRKYKAEALPPKGHFHYHQGVFLSGMLKIATLSARDDIFIYAKNWIDSVFNPDASAKLVDYGDLDDIQPGIILYPIYDRTGNEIYRKEMDYVVGEYNACPRCKNGGLYHKVNLTGQMWLDGLYMVGPFIAEYGRRFNHPEYIDAIYHEVITMRNATRDEKTGLWYHAWDETRTAPWADKFTGRSGEFWGRSIGWVPVAILDIIDQMDDGDLRRIELVNVAVDLLSAVMRYQGKDGRWYQVVDKPNADGNWPENSCTSLFAAAIAKAVCYGFLPKADSSIAEKAFKGVADSLEINGDDLEIGNVCIGTCVGDYDFYINRPCSINDLHGVGTFLLMCASIEEMRRSLKYSD